MDNYKQLYEKDNEEYKGFYPLTDILSIIDKESGKNLKQLLNQYNHIKLDWKGNTVDTRNSVPLILRHKGLFVTYDNGTSIITEFYKGEDISVSINSIWQNDNNWTDLSPGVSLADNEDIAEIDGKFKFADRNYNAAQFTGMGRVILRKNLTDVGDGMVKNVLTQDIINKSNTIYEIRYDFDLNGSEITIPEGCVLDFQGGSLNNGTIIGNSTDIKANLIKIFGTNIEFGGIWNVVEVYPEWFGLKYNINTYGKINVLSINKSIQLQVLGAKKVVVNKGDIYVDVEKYENTWGIDSPTIKLLSNSNIELKNARIIVNENDFLGYYVFSAINVQNVKLNGGIIIGDVRNHAGNDGEFGYGLYIAGSQNIQVSNMEFNEFWGDGIILIYDSSNKSESSGIDSEKHPRDIYINNVKCLRNRRQGISICDGINIKISNSSFNETGSIKYTLPCSGMDLEPNGDFEFVKDVSCVNCEFKNNKGYSVTSWYNNNNVGREVTDSNLVSAYFSNCDFTSDTISKINVLAGKTIFTNCKFDEVWNATGTLNQGSYIIQDSEIKRVVFNGKPLNRILKNCIFKDYNQYISWDSLEFNNSYLIDCTFIVNNDSIVCTNWGGAVYSTKIINVQPKIINIGDNSSYEMEIHKVQLIRPIVINCKLSISVSKPIITTDDYYHMIASITNTTSMSNGTLASVGKVPFFSYGGKWYDSMGYKPENKRGLHGERPTNLTEDDAGYLFYNISYKTWMFWNGTEWKRMGTNNIGEILGRESQRPSGVNQGYQYFDVNLNKPIWWTGEKWVDANGADV